MSNITTRAGKGSPLTNNELDANFTNLNSDKVEIGGDLSGTSSAPNVAKIQGRAVSTDAPAAGEKLVWNGTAWEPSTEPTGEPIGHADKTQSSISFDSGTRTFTIAPVAAEFVVWCKGVKYTYTSAQTVVIPNTTGLHFIYFNQSGVLSTQMSYFTWEDHAPTAYVYWNATTSTAVYFGDERHGITLDWQTHEYLHRTRGAAIANGFGASGYTTTGLGATDADAQIDIGGGTFFDEDMQVDIVSTNSPVANTWQQDLSGPARIPVLYLSGNAWVIDAPTDFPFKVVGGIPQYNLYSGGTWSTASVNNNEYFVSWILATNNLNYPVVSIISQAPTNQLSQAEAMTFEGLSLSGFPSVEFRPLYKVIYTHKTGFTNSVKASTVAVYDLRALQSAGVAAALVQDHGNLSGLGDDDHAQYLHVSEVRSPSAAVKNSFLPSQASNSGKYLSTDGTNPSWVAIPSGSLNFTGDVTGTGTTGSPVALTLANSGVTAGTYSKVTVDGKGRVTVGTNIASGDVTTALGFTPENAANKGVANGYAGLDSSGKIASSHLPSYVDDVLEYANLAAFPATGDSGKIYIAIDSAKVYRWSGSTYVEISASPGSTDAVPEGSTNLYHTTSRVRTSISASGSLSYNNTTGIFSYTTPNSDGITEGSTNLYFTNARARSAISASGSLSYNSSTGVMSFTDAVTSVAGRTGAVTLTSSDVGLGNVENKSSATIRGEITSGNVTTALGFTPLASGAKAADAQLLDGYDSTAFSGPVSTIKQFFWNDLSASGTQARTYEIARLGIDYNDWNGGSGPFEVELYEAYYSRGLKKKYVIYWGYTNSYGIQLVEYSGSGDNNFQCRIGTPVQTSGDNYYLPVFVDVRYYAGCDVRVTTNRDITTNNPPGVGSTFINQSPSATNISDFTADSTVNFASTTAVQIGGNQLVHAGNFTTFSLSSGQVTTALGYTPYNSTNPNSYITSAGSITGNAATATTATTATYDFSSNVDMNSIGGTNSVSFSNLYYPGGGGYNQPIGGGQHFRVISFGRYNAGDPNYWRGQIAQSFYEDRMWFRKEYSQTWGSWREFIHTGNVGSYALPISGGLLTGSLGHQRGTHNYFERSSGINVGAVGWHTDDYFYVAGHPSFGPSAGNDVRVYAFGNKIHLGSAGSGDVLTINGSTSTFNGTVQVINGPAQIITGSLGVGDAGTRGLIFDGNYTNGQYRHRFRKLDDGGGLPLYIDYAHSTANSFTTIARFGGGGSYRELEIYGAMNATTLLQGGNQVLHAGNVGTYALPIAGGTVTGTATFSAQAANFGDGASNSGIGIYHGSGSSDYGRVRFYQAGSNNQTIHAFSTNWQGGTLSSTAAGSINISGANGVTFGPWNVVSGYITNAGDFWTRSSIATSGNISGVNYTGTRFIALYANPNDNINGAPWYGLGGAGNLFGPGDTVQLAGYYGLRLRTASAWLDLYQGSAYYSSTFNAVTLQNSGNQVLHVGNYSSYALPLSGGNLTGQTKLIAGHTNTRFQLHYNHDGNDNSGGAGYLTLWASEPGISYAYAGLGANVNIGGQYYGRQSTGQTYGVYIRWDTSAGQTQFWNTTATPGPGGGQGTLRAFIASDGEIYATASSHKVIHAGNFNDYTNLRNRGNVDNFDFNTYGNFSSNIVSGYIESSPNKPTSYAYPYGTVLSFNAGPGQAQFYVSHAGNDLTFRGGWSGSSWQTWNRVLTNQNYNSYSPTLTGGNASGSWGISVTGSSNSVNSTGFGNNNFTWRQDSGTFAGQSGWASYLISSHGDGDTYYSQTLIMPFWSAPQYSRKQGSSSVVGPYTFLTTENYSNYALPLSGGTLTGDIVFADNSVRTLRNASNNAGYRPDDVYGNTYMFNTGGGWYGDFAGYYWRSTGSVNLATLDSSGNFVATANVTAYSDERVKTNWRPVRRDFIEALAAVKSGVYERTDVDVTQAGVSAQSLRPVLPEAVLESAEGDLSVAYGNAAMVSAVELAKELVQLKRELAELKSKLH